MYCKKCGRELEEGFVCCPNCGTFIDSALDNRGVEQKEEYRVNQSNVFSIIAICTFIIPLLGWIFGGLGIKKSKELNGKGKILSIVAIVLSFGSFIFNIYYTQKHPELFEMFVKFWM